MSQPANVVDDGIKELSDALIMQEMQLLLSEKRTALSTLRTGLGIFAFPLSVLSVLIATSKAYSVSHVIYWLVALIAINLGLISLAIYLIVHGIRRLRHYDWIIAEHKRRYSRLKELLD